MDKIYYIVDWGKDKERSWSGTNLGIYKALKKITNVDDINIYRDTHKSIITKLFNKISHKSNDFGLAHIKKSRKLVENYISKKGKAPIFQFAEIIYDELGMPTYIYQDLSVAYVKFMSDSDPSIFQLSGFGNIDKRFINNRYQLQMDYYNHCKGIFTMGKWLEKDLIERCGISASKVHHIGGGINVDKDLINPQNKTGNKILFIGRDFKRKGGYLVYDAFKKLKKDIPDLELYVAGPQTDPIKSPVNGYYYLGNCTHKELSDLFNKCDIFCMPSYFEAYGLVFIEALTYGLPCIGRNAYEMPYFIEDNETGYLLKHNDASELSSLIADLLKNDRIKRNVLEKKDWYLKEYSWETVANRIYDVINKN